MSADELWIPLVDEPIGEIVARIQQEEPEIARVVDSPRRVLAFRTFAYIRVGMLLGELLVEHDLEPYDGSMTWVERLLEDERHRATIQGEVRAVAEEIASDPYYASEPELGPDEETRARLREFARRRLSRS